MSATQSNLSGTGFDIVVAATQGSINDTMKEYLADVTQPEVTVCYVANEQGIATPIAYETLKSNAKGTDPFSIPAGADPATDPGLRNLFDARFMFGIRARVGLPRGYAPASLPNIVALGANTSTVTFTLTCSEFTLVQYTPASGYGPASWMNQSQPDGNAWLFTTQVNLSLSSAEYDDLPPAVRARIKNLGGSAFSVQQLLFDLRTAALESIPRIQGVQPGTPLYAALENDFTGAYFATLQQHGMPVLGYGVTRSNAPPSTLPLTDLNFWSAPYLDTNGQPVTHPTPAQQDGYTLNYLCATNGDPLPAPRAFGWNWVDESDQGRFDGVVAISRKTFANYFRNQLKDYVARNCYRPSVRVTVDKLKVKYSWSLTPGQAAKVEMPATGPTVLRYTWSDSPPGDEAGAGGGLGAMKMSTSFNLSVSFSGNTITITQHLVIYAYVRSLATDDGANVVDKTITDTYTITADQNGRLVAVANSEHTDHSGTPNTNAFLDLFTGVNGLGSDVAKWARGMAPTRFTDVPVSVVQDFVFPGGRTFVFKDAAFSEYQDLVARITYADPG